MKNKYLSMIFLKVHLLIEENRSEAISGRFQWFKGKNNQGGETFAKIAVFFTERIFSGMTSDFDSCVQTVHVCRTAHATR